VVASDPYHYGGAWDRQTSEKVNRMVDLAQLFHLPALHLVDIPGFRIGLEAEVEGVMRAGVRALTAVSQTTIPWCTVIIRKAFGVAGAAHQHPDRFSFRYAWPSAVWGSLPIEGGLEVAYKADIEATADPEPSAAHERRVRALFRRFWQPGIRGRRHHRPAQTRAVDRIRQSGGACARQPHRAWLPARTLNPEPSSLHQRPRDRGARASAPPCAGDAFSWSRR
jgi:acetyl-CoA carboxylase carboxyltransferase component